MYQGSWLNGLQDGWGTYKDESSSFSGTWKAGSKVEGSLNYEERNETYVGTFLNGLKHIGIMTYANGDEFSGEYVDGRRCVGQMTYKETGHIFNGEYNELGQMHGAGKMIYENGDVFTG
jgi:hypothetical protein